MIFDGALMYGEQGNGLHHNFCHVTLTWNPHNIKFLIIFFKF